MGAGVICSAHPASHASRGGGVITVYGQPPGHAPGFQGYAPAHHSMGGAGFAGGGPVELGPAENAIVSKTASRARTWGIVAMVVGVLSVLGLVGAIVALSLVAARIPDDAPLDPVRLVFVALLPAALVHLGVGVVYIRAGSSLRAVVDTQGDDLRHLMTALQRLRLAFQVEVGVTLVSFVVGLVAAALSSSAFEVTVR
jgi:hypothetical protein